MRRFFIHPGQVHAPAPRLTGAEVKHIRKVLRYGPGDTIRLIDGTGYEYNARIEKFTGDSVMVTVLDSRVAATDSPIEMVVAQGFLKDKKMDELVRHLTELGMAQWIPMVSSRSVARPDEKRMTERMKRWEAIAVEAMKQSGQSRMPALLPVHSLADVLAMAGDFDARLIFWEQATVPLTETKAPSPSKILLLLGPEGGLTVDEVEDAQTAGFTPVSIGPRILRAETAALAACTLVQYIFGDLKKSP
ncbi:MAG: 16S rRNA (uracil(1498)-N(3))-methyltransferase [Thermodesulfobacteriota bacterium]